jgi:hypothetical protein
LQVLASAVDQNPLVTIPPFMQTFHPPFPVGFDDITTAIEFMQHPPMLIPHVPLLAFIDRQGMIQAQYERDHPTFFNDEPKSLRDEIEKLLNQGKAPAKSGPAKKAPVKKSAAK